MRRLVLACSVMLTAGAAACSNASPFPPDLITVKGQALRGTVPADAALVFGFDRSQIAGAVGDASLFTAPGPTFADGTGHFSIYGYGSNYDLAVSAAGSPQDITIVRNLTRRDPAIVLPADANASSYSCHIAVSWNAPPPQGANVAYFLQGPGYSGVELLGVAPTDSNYLDGVDATWRGSLSTSATLWVIAFTKDANTGLPTAWNGSAAGLVELVDGRATTFFTVLQPITTSTLSVATQTPTGYAIDNVDVLFDFASGTSIDIAHFTGAAASAPPSLLIPDLPFNRLRVVGVAHDGAAISYGAAAAVAGTPNQVTSATLAFAAAPPLTGPDPGATSVSPTTPFSWNAVSGVNEVTIASASPGTPNLRVVTNESSISLGALSALTTAAQFPVGSIATWSVRNYPDLPSSDPLEAPGFDRTQWRSAESEPRTFTVSAPQN